MVKVSESFFPLNFWINSFYVSGNVLDFDDSNNGNIQSLFQKTLSIKEKVTFRGIIISCGITLVNINQLSI